MIHNSRNFTIIQIVNKKNWHFIRKRWKLGDLTLKIFNTNHEKNWWDIRYNFELFYSRKLFLVLHMGPCMLWDGILLSIMWSTKSDLLWIKGGQASIKLRQNGLAGWSLKYLLELDLLWDSEFVNKILKCPKTKKYNIKPLESFSIINMKLL